MRNSKTLITLREPNSMVSESYKMLRTNLSYMNVDNNNQVILFTSSSSEEGKTTTICNLAVEMAKSGSKVLLIESDLRKARIHNIFHLPQSPGVVNVLLKDFPLTDTVWQVKDLPNLDILTAGPLPPSPADLLSSKKFEEMIKDARGEYDKILIDAPPVLTVTDAAIVSRLVDGVIIIAASGETKKDILVQAKKHLEKVEANVLGVVLTKVELSKSTYYSGYKSYYGSDKKTGFLGLFGKKKRDSDMDYLDEDMPAKTEIRTRPKAEKAEV